MTANGATQAVERPVIRLFGPLSIELCGRRLGPGDLGGARPKQVLEILLAARGHRVPDDRLADLLWGQQLPQNAAGSLQTFVSVLRRHLVPDRTRAPRARDHGGRGLPLRHRPGRARPGSLRRRSSKPPPTSPRGSRAARSSRRSRSCAATCSRTSRTRGWTQELRNTYRGRVLGAHVEAADAALAELDYAAALAPHARRPLRSTRSASGRTGSQMLALYALGRQHEALDSYRRFRARLDDELGLEPTAETRGLEAAILRQDDVRLLLPRPIVARRRRRRPPLRAPARTRVPSSAPSTARSGRRSTARRG